MIDTDSVLKQTGRRIVMWSDQDDCVLREQVGIHGTENWTCIASVFKDKTARQCRRRWYTYLNSDFKKGGWSPEEDILLCVAQKIYGNRWTEISRMVPGRTDNAVKNRFSTLSRKRAKYEVLGKENNPSYVNQNNKRVIIGCENSTDRNMGFDSSIKGLRRSHIPNSRENYDGKNLHRKCDNTVLPQQLGRLPFAELDQNIYKVGGLSVLDYFNNIKKPSYDDAQSNKIRGAFFKKDDPKITALTQQAELLTSLAQKINTENTDQCLESSLKAFQDFLNRNEENDLQTFKTSDTDFQPENFKDLVADQMSNYRNSPSCRQPDLYAKSSGSFEYSTGFSLLSQITGNRNKQYQSEFLGAHENIGLQVHSVNQQNQNGIHSSERGDQAEKLSCDEPEKNEVVSITLSGEFSSPINVTSFFQSSAGGIPSPMFSESERQYLMKTLGMESPITNPCQPPACKRALLNSL